MQREVYKIDVKGKSPGRVASMISMLLQGKNKANWDPATDMGGKVEISGVTGLKITGAKLVKKIYYSHSGYPGGLRSRQMKDVSPEFIIKHAVLKMLPKNRLQKERMKRIKFV